MAQPVIEGVPQFAGALPINQPLLERSDGFMLDDDEQDCDVCSDSGFRLDWDERPGQIPSVPSHLRFGTLPYRVICRCDYSGCTCDRENTWARTQIAGALARGETYDCLRELFIAHPRGDEWRCPTQAPLPDHGPIHLSDILQRLRLSGVIVALHGVEYAYAPDYPHGHVSVAGDFLRIHCTPGHATDISYVTDVRTVQPHDEWGWGMPPRLQRLRRRTLRAPARASKPRVQPRRRPLKRRGTRGLTVASRARVVRAPVAMGIEAKGEGNNFPLVGSEYTATSLNESTGFATYLYALNPANTVLHPNAARVGAMFERYRVNSIEFEWVPFKSTATDGYVILTYYSNPQSVSPTDLGDATTAPAYYTGPLWKPGRLRPRISQSYDWLYTRTGNNTPAGTVNDFGVLYAVTQGTSTPAELAGYVRVHYNYTLRDLVKDTPAPQ